MMVPDPFPLDNTVLFEQYPIRYHTQGHGRTLIMLHNGGTSHRIWKHQIPFFASSYRVIAIDLLGFGKSGRPDSPLTLSRYVAMLHTLIHRLNLERPILMGNCIGAAMALEFAWQHPERVTALVLSNVCGGASMMRYYHPFLFPGGRSLPSAYYRFMGRFARPLWMRRQMVARLFGTRDYPRDALYHHLLDAIAHPLQARSRLRLLQGMPFFNKFDHLDQPPPLPVPTMICWGENNRVLPIERGRRLISALQPDTHLIFPQSGHLPMVEQPDLFNQESLAFLQDQTGRQAVSP